MKQYAEFIGAIAICLAAIILLWVGLYWAMGESLH